MSGTKKKPAVGVAWEAPPSVDRPDWALLAEELRAHPMEWQKVYEHGRESWANAISRGRIRPLRAELGFEFRTTNNQRIYGKPRTCTLYLRFNPDKVDPLAELLAGRK